MYTGTKGAVDSITRSLAQELGPKNIRVVAVAPRMTLTEGVQEMGEEGGFVPYAVSRTPLGRIGKPSDIASVVAFVASDQASWITGQVIGVSGGLRL